MIRHVIVGPLTLNGIQWPEPEWIGWTNEPTSFTYIAVLL
jgi:hypothetical protein